MITIKATNMYDVAKEAQEKNREKFDTYFETVVRCQASKGMTIVSFDDDDEEWRALTEQQKDDVVGELKDAGFFVATRRFSEPLLVKWEKKQ